MTLSEIRIVFIFRDIEMCQIYCECDVQAVGFALFILFSLKLRKFRRPMTSDKSIQSSKEHSITINFKAA